MDVDGSGLLSQADFVSPYFNLLDINHDGYVSREEYEVGLVKFDGDKDGKIETFEFLGSLAGYEISSMEGMTSKTKHPKIWMRWSSISPQEARELYLRQIPPVHGKPSQGTLLQSMHFEVGY
jgi:hypothetical protein